MNGDRDQFDADTESVDLLVQQAATGDADAFRQIMDGFSPQVRGFVERRMDNQLRKRLDTSDVLQQTFAKVHQRLQEFATRRPMPLKIWLLKTAMEQLRDERVKHLKRHKRAASREVRSPDNTSMVLAGTLATHSTPSKIAMRREQQAAVAEMIDSLALGDRDILLLRHVDLLTFDEIGALLEINTGAARKRYARAVVRLRQLCVEQDINGEI